MSVIEKWAERVYAETDVGRSVATSLAGVLGLGIYLKSGDWVIAAFASVVFFPLARLTASSIHERFTRRSRQKSERENTEHVSNSLGDDEQTVVCPCSLIQVVAFSLGLR